MADETPQDVDDALAGIGETHTHELRTSPLVWGVFAALALMAVAVMVLTLHVQARQQISDDRQGHNQSVQHRLNAEQNGTRHFACLLAHYALPKLGQPRKPAIRRALRLGLAQARCAQVVYRAQHPSPAPSPRASVVMVPTPGPTATVTMMRPGPTRTVHVTRSPKSCDGVSYRGRCVPVTPAPTPSLPVGLGGDTP